MTADQFSKLSKVLDAVVSTEQILSLVVDVSGLASHEIVAVAKAALPALAPDGPDLASDYDAAKAKAEG